MKYRIFATIDQSKTGIGDKKLLMKLYDSPQLRIPVLAKEVEYLFWVWMA